MEQEGVAMRQRSWSLYVWYALAALEALMMLADLIGGQDPYRHKVLMMLAVLLCYACDIKERLE